MTAPCVLELEGVPIPVWQAEFTLAVIHGGGGGGGPGGPVAWGSITGTIASQADLAAALAAKADLATLAPVATSGAYAALTGRPMLGTAAAANVGDFAPTVHAHLAASITDSTPTGRALLTAVDAAAARAVIGTTQSAWGNISGTLSAQADLSAALAGKLSAASNLGDLTDTAAARINLGLGALAVKNTVAVADVSASGTPGASTFLRGDGTWAVPPASSGGGGGGGGDMQKSAYDSNGDGKVNAADVADFVPWAGVTGKPATFTPDVHAHGVASSGAPGFMSAPDKSKLDGIYAGATANAADAQLRDRSTHTGTQSIGTVDGLQAALDGKQPATAFKTINGETITGAGNIVVSGGGGGGQTYTVGVTAISAFSVAAVNASGQLVPADCTTAANAGAVVGIVSAAAAPGSQALPHSSGVVTSPAWAWTPGANIAVGTSGALVAALPGNAAFAQVVGTSISATSINIAMQPPVLLAQ